MQHGDAVGETGSETADGLGREGDLGHEHNCLSAGSQRLLQGVEVQLRLAAARHPVQ